MSFTTKTFFDSEISEFLKLLSTANEWDKNFNILKELSLIYDKSKKFDELLGKLICLFSTDLISFEQFRLFLYDTSTKERNWKLNVYILTSLCIQNLFEKGFVDKNFISKIFSGLTKYFNYFRKTGDNNIIAIVDFGNIKKGPLWNCLVLPFGFIYKSEFSRKIFTSILKRHNIEIGEKAANLLSQDELFSNYDIKFDKWSLITFKFEFANNIRKVKIDISLQETNINLEKPKYSFIVIKSNGTRQLKVVNYELFNSDIMKYYMFFMEFFQLSFLNNNLDVADSVFETTSSELVFKNLFYNGKQIALPDLNISLQGINEFNFTDYVDFRKALEKKTLFYPFKLIPNPSSTANIMKKWIFYQNEFTEPLIYNSNEIIPTYFQGFDIVNQLKMVTIYSKEKIDTFDVLLKLSIIKAFKSFMNENSTKKIEESKDLKKLITILYNTEDIISFDIFNQLSLLEDNLLFQKKCIVFSLRLSNKIFSYVVNLQATNFVPEFNFTNGKKEEALAFLILLEPKTPYLDKMISEFKTSMNNLKMREKYSDSIVIYDIYSE